MGREEFVLVLMLTTDAQSPPYIYVTIWRKKKELLLFQFCHDFIPIQDNDSIHTFEVNSFYSMDLTPDTPPSCPGCICVHVPPSGQCWWRQFCEAEWQPGYRASFFQHSDPKWTVAAGWFSHCLSLHEWWSQSYSQSERPTTHTQTQRGIDICTYKKIHNITKHEKSYFKLCVNVSACALYLYVCTSCLFLVIGRIGYS